MIKRIIFLCIFSVIFSVGGLCVSEPDISAQSAVVINAQTFEVVFEKNSHEKRSMASTTKIMTALLACESDKLNDAVTAVDFAAEGTSIGLKKGDKLYLRDLVYAMMLESGNDAARLTATYLAGSESAFADLMNEKAHEIGMSNTNFVTASGLDADEHYSTAYDMALLGVSATENTILREIMSIKSYKAEFISPEKSITFYNHNRLLDSCEGVFGIKTGFTKKSGRCLVTACERDGATFVAVTLRAPDDWNDHKKLYEYAFGCLKSDKIAMDSRLTDIPVCGGNKTAVSLACEIADIELKYKNEQTYELRTYLPCFLYAPVEKGDIIGRAELCIKGRVIAESLIYCAESAECSITEEKISIIDFLLDLLGF